MMPRRWRALRAALHALWSDVVFTVGLGWYLWGGGSAEPGERIMRRRETPEARGGWVNDVAGLPGGGYG